MVGKMHDRLDRFGYPGPGCLDSCSMSKYAEPFLGDLNVLVRLHWLVVCKAAMLGKSFWV